ncbi:RimK family alpha-L-glutamate ligase [Mesorhizobium sp. ES1-4]|uniref:ATP-grasp domain-containing protein n=1 Tax=Mesorhizobium sp. ES1-4 TaxID=2876627 RepID=UPI001CCA6A34|nr:tetratricopeptide repeat-containing protein [Mesorhizobium sp. ES1-4]MBZ9797678.1 tetratricopeptide repeat-containing protein [Mesorhizobium sp. ES1-4]
MGKAPIVRAVFEGRDISPLWNGLFGRISADITDAAAFLDVSILLHAIGEEDKAALSQKAALEISRQYRVRNGRGTGPNVLVFMTAGDFMANTPIEFLLENSDANLLLYYVDADTADLGDVPVHDVAFVAVGESAENLAVLANLDRLLRGWSGPIMNNAPRLIMALSRDGVAEALKDEPLILAPAAARAGRAVIERLACGEIEVEAILGAATFPVIVRPFGTHAGKGMEKISTRPELSAYLNSHDESQFYITPFIDYSGPDGKFRKQRVAFINGRPYASHLAVSEHWMVHYLNAGMTQHEDRRAEEASWMANFDSDFAVRHARAFDALHRRLGLDYFAIDCAELADGRLLVFEADVAMIVHSMDLESIFPYKKNAMRKLFAAFEGALERRVARIKPTPTIVCAHTGKPAVYQRTHDDCLVCALAMLTGRTYEEIEDIARGCDPAYPLGGPMSHSIMRGVANKCGFVLLSSIYMLWAKPAIIGVVSPTVPNTGHAVFWDGEKIIDPGWCERVDRSYVDRCGLEFTQRASDLEPLISHDIQISYLAGAVAANEPL